MSDQPERVLAAEWRCATGCLRRGIVLMSPPADPEIWRRLMDAGESVRDEDWADPVQVAGGSPLVDVLAERGYHVQAGDLSDAEDGCPNCGNPTYVRLAALLVDGTDATGM